MKRKNPTLLPGKELWDIHFDPIAAGRTSVELKRKELKPLISLAKAKMWIDEEKLVSIESEIMNGTINSLWPLASSWLSRIDSQDENQSHAYAGWLFLWNLKKFENLVGAFKPPYKGLHSLEIHETIKRLLKALTVESIEGGSKETLKRHFLGLVICEKSLSTGGTWGPESNSTQPESWYGLKRELLDKEYYRESLSSKNSKPWLLTPSHGFMEKGKQTIWVSPELKNPLSKAMELLRGLPRLTVERLVNLKEKIERI